MAAVAEPLDIVKLRSLRNEFGTTVLRDSVLYSPGDAAEELYVVMSGRVQVERPSTGEEVIEPGGLVGEVDLFAGEPRSGSATALSDCSLLAFDRESVSRLAEITPTFALLAIRSACQRVVRLEHLLADAGQPADTASGSPIEAAAVPTEPAPAAPQAAKPRAATEPIATQAVSETTGAQHGGREGRTAAAALATPNVTATGAGEAEGHSASTSIAPSESTTSAAAAAEPGSQPVIEVTAAPAAGSADGPTAAVSALAHPGTRGRVRTPGTESSATPTSQRSTPGTASTGPSATVPQARPQPDELVSQRTVGPVLHVDYLSSLSHKEAHCPNCHTAFRAWSVRSEAATVVSRDQDFMNHYQGVDPTWYAVWVCPKCQLAAYADEFATIHPEQLARVRHRLDYIRSSDPRSYHFSHYRDADLALRSFQLAVARYADEDAAADRIASLFHRMAWIERARGNKLEERHWLQTARQYYELAFRVQDSSQMGLVWSYLIAELNVRLGDYANALRWFDTASRLPHFRQQSTLDKMLRDRQQEVAQMLRSQGSLAVPQPTPEDSMQALPE